MTIASASQGARISNVPDAALDFCNRLSHRPIGAPLNAGFD